MEPQKSYPTRIDRWIVVMLVLPMLLVLGLGGWLLPKYPLEALSCFGTLAFSVGLVALIGYPCHYTLMDDHLLVRSGKSIEEVSRDGVFVYADFNGRSVTGVSSGRDPDPQTPNVLFYVRFEEDKWRIDVYRQNRGRGFQGGSDASFVEAFQQWLVSGGVPRADFLSPR